MAVRRFLHEYHPARVAAAEAACRSRWLASQTRESSDDVARACERASGARARSARSLEEVTLNDRHTTLEHTTLELRPVGEARERDEWRLKVTEYSSGVVEVRGVLGLTSRCPREKSEASMARRSVKAEGERFLSSVKRSRRLLRERCLELNADNLLTLTKRGKFSSVDELWAAFARFNRLMSRFYGDKWRYVAVPELHADGETYHMHVATRGYFWHGIVRKIWYRALGGRGDEQGDETPGNIDFSAPRRVRGSSARKALRLAGYVAKYVGKGFAAGNRSRRLFAASRGLNPRHIERWCVRDWRGIPELVGSIQVGLASAGCVGAGECYFWSRHRDDGSLLMHGFVLTTERVH